MQKIRSPKNNQKKYTKKEGSTITEVIVAFVIVLLMVAAFSKTTNLASQMLTQSLQRTRQIEKFDQNYYKKTANFQPVNGLSFSLSIDTNKTDTKNKYTFKQPISLNDEILQKYEDTQEGQSGLKRYTFKSKE